MKLSIVTLAAVAAIGFAGAAFDAEATKGSTAAPADMTESQMDAVTAAGGGNSGNAGQGLYTAGSVASPNASTSNGGGVCQTGQSGRC